MVRTNIIWIRAEHPQRRNRLRSEFNMYSFIFVDTNGHGLVYPIDTKGQVVDIGDYLEVKLNNTSEPHYELIRKKYLYSIRHHATVLERLSQNEDYTEYYLNYWVAGDGWHSVPCVIKNSLSIHLSVGASITIANFNDEVEFGNRIRIEWRLFAVHSREVELSSVVVGEEINWVRDGF